MNLEEALNRQPESYARLCQFAPWFIKQSEDDRNAIVRAFDNPDIRIRHIWKTLKEFGCDLSEATIRTHRLGECQHCERTNYGQHV